MGWVRLFLDGCVDKPLLYTLSRTSTRFLLLGICTSIVMTASGCDHPHPESTDASAFVSPEGGAINIGRESIILHKLARKWQLTRIDDTPILDTVVVLDFSHIAQQKAVAVINPTCQPILMTMDIRHISKGTLFTQQITRELDNCSTPLEDHLMAIIADTHAFDESALIDNQLILKSFQNKIYFMPYPKP